MIRHRFILSIVFLLSVQLNGCANIFYHPKNEAMYVKASALTKLSASVESTIRYKNPPENISDEDLLMLATEHDPALLSPFAENSIRIFRENRHSAVLICTKDGASALLEDTACTAALDKHRWQITADPCKFTLDLNLLCTSQ